MPCSSVATPQITMDCGCRHSTGKTCTVSEYWYAMSPHSPWWWTVFFQCTVRHMFSSLCLCMLKCPGPQWFGSVHYMDCYRLSYQLLIGSPSVGCVQEHCGYSLSVHPVWRGDDMVSSGWMTSRKHQYFVPGCHRHRIKQYELPCICLCVFKQITAI